MILAWNSRLSDVSQPTRLTVTIARKLAQPAGSSQGERRNDRKSKRFASEHRASILAAPIKPSPSFIGTISSGVTIDLSSFIRRLFPRSSRLFVPSSAALADSNHRDNRSFSRATRFVRLVPVRFLGCHVSLPR